MPTSENPVSSFPANFRCPAIRELSRAAHRQSVNSLLFLEFGKCHEKVGGRVQVVPGEALHEPLNNRGAVHTVAEFLRHPDRHRDKRQSERHIAPHPGSFINVHSESHLEENNHKGHPSHQSCQHTAHELAEAPHAQKVRSSVRYWIASAMC